MKKIASVLLVVAMLSALSVGVSAGHHGSRGHSSAAVRYAVCTYDECNLTGIHRHGGYAYSGHYYNDGHDWHNECTYDDCDLLHAHRHSKSGGRHAIYDCRAY